MVQDISIGSDYDLVFSNGDFLVSDSDQQHLALIVKTAVGAWKQFPLQGVGIVQYSGSSGMEATIAREIKVKAEADGFKNINVAIRSDSSGYFVANLDAERP